MATTYTYTRDIQKDPTLYEAIHDSRSWILKEPFIFDFFSRRIKKDAALLDIGCGNGYFLDWLKQNGYTNIAGVDLANFLKDKAIRHYGVDVNRGDLPFPDASIDVITALQVLEHLENYFLILQEVKRALRPGGFFIISVPNQFNIFYRLKFFLTGNVTGWNKKNNHLLFLTRDVFRKTYLDGFRVSATHYSRGPVPMLGRLNIVPGVHFPARVKILPRSEYFADRVCFVLEKDR